MKGLMKWALLAVLVMGSAMTMAQTPKFGYINSQELISLMPELDSVKVKMQAYEKELQDQAEAIQVEFNKKMDDYQKKAETMTPAIREQKEKELSDIRTRFQEFQAAAQKDMEEQYNALMRPIITKAQEAIKKVAKANGMTMVFDLANGGLVYYDEATTVNLLPLVKNELKIVAKK